MTHDYPDPASLIPAIGAMPQAERMFRINWVGNLTRSPTGAPLVSPHFTAKQGGRVRLIDIREEDGVLGPLGYMPGSDWIPEGQVQSLSLRLDEDEAVILLSSDGEHAAAVAQTLERGGLRFVAAMVGGLVAWRDYGYWTLRDRAVLERRDVLRRFVAQPLPAGEELSREHVERHVGEATSVRWIKLAALLLHGRLSCVDGRDDAGVLGAPGGDAGELVLALSAIEALSGRSFTQAEVDVLLRRRMDAIGRFYLHTDITAANHGIKRMRADSRFDEALAHVSEALEWRDFWLGPPEHVRAPLLEYAVEPGTVGCGHLRRALQYSAEYNTRTELVGAVLSAFHRERWAGSTDAELVLLAGDHHEGSVLNVRVEGGVFPFTRIPLVSPSAFGKQMFVYHPQVASYLRRQLAELLVAQRDLVPTLDPAALHSEMERIAALQIASTLGALAKGLPIFDVTFDTNGHASVEARGHV